MSIKFCQKCQNIRHITEFGKAKGRLYSTCKVCKKEYKTLNKLKIKEWHKEHYQQTKEQHDLITAKNRPKYREKKLQNLKKWKLANPDKVKQYKKVGYERIKNDPIKKLKLYIRNRIQKSLVAKGFRKTKSITEFVGCNLEDFKKHLESQFQKGMSWDNYGKWHVDHKIPLVTANTEEEIYKLNYYTNLQPLWAEDNLKKGGR